MANPTTRIVITASDQASPVIRRIGMEMAGLGQTADSIGKMGSLTGFGAGLMALANPVTAVTAGLTALELSAIRADARLQRIEKSFSIIEVGGSGAASRMRMIREEADRVGASYLDMAEEAKKFYAAANASPVGKYGDQIFRALNTTGAAMGIDSQGQASVIRAVQQMMSKGKVSAEELRQQLAEQLPGAVQIFAEALGVSEQKLDKMLEKGEVTLDVLPKVAEIMERRFGAGLAQTTDHLTANLERLNNSWTAFLSSVAMTDTANVAVKGLTGTVEWLNTWVNRAADGWFRLNKVMSGTVAPQQLRDIDPREYGAMFGDQAMSGQDRQIIALMEKYGAKTNDELAKKYPRELASVTNRKYVESLGGVMPQDPVVDEAKAKKLRDTLQSITRELERMTDTGTDGAARLADLRYKMEDYVEELGAGHPKVREFADVIAYANEHLGYTPQQVAKATRAVNEQVEALQDRAEAMRAATRSDGTIDQQRLNMLTAISAAQRQYTKDVQSGADQSTAAARRDLSISNARADARQQDLAVIESFYSTLAGMYQNDEGLQRRLLDKQVENYRAAGVAEVDIAKWKARRELEISQNAYDGMRRSLLDWFETSSNVSGVVANATSTVMEGTESLVSGMLRRSGNAWQDYGNMALDVLSRIAAKLLMLQAMDALGVSEGLGGYGMALTVGGAIMNAFTSSAFSSASSLTGATPGAGATAGELSTYFSLHHGGGTVGSGPKRRGDPAWFAGAPRYHSGGMIPGLSPGEVPIIAQTGERVQSRGEVAAMTASGGSILRALNDIREAVARQNWTNVNVTDKSLIYEAMATPQGRKILLNHVGAAPTEFRSALS